MKLWGRILSILGMVVLIVAVTGVTLARHYRRQYQQEREARFELVAAASNFFINTAQDFLFRANLAVSRENFEAARDEIRESRRVVDAFARMPFAAEVKGDRDLASLYSEAESELARFGADSQRKLLAIINVLEDVREGLKEKR